MKKLILLLLLSCLEAGIACGQLGGKYVMKPQTEKQKNNKEDRNYLLLDKNYRFEYYDYPASRDFGIYGRWEYLDESTIELIFDPLVGALEQLCNSPWPYINTTLRIVNDDMLMITHGNTEIEYERVDGPNKQPLPGKFVRIYKPGIYGESYVSYFVLEDNKRFKSYECPLSDSTTHEGGWAYLGADRFKLTYDKPLLNGVTSDTIRIRSDSLLSLRSHAPVEKQHYYRRYQKVQQQKPAPGEFIVDYYNQDDRQVDGYIILDEDDRFVLHLDFLPEYTELSGSWKYMGGDDIKLYFDGSSENIHDVAAYVGDTLKIVNNNKLLLRGGTDSHYFYWECFREKKRPPYNVKTLICKR